MGPGPGMPPTAPNDMPTKMPARPPPSSVPNPSLYVNNLTEKIKIDELKKALFHVFSQFGNIVEICANKDLKRRGQAWVIFEKVESASKALEEMTSFSFYGRPMQVSYARVKSDVVSKKDGTFEHRPKRKVEKKRKKGKKGGEKKKKEKKKKTEKTAEDEDGEGPPPPAPTGAKAEPGAPAPMEDAEPRGPPSALPPAPPNRILFVENLPIQCTNIMLSMLFQQYMGFKEARLVNGKPGIAFVEFDDPAQAMVAKQALHNFKITQNNNMKVTYARQ